MIRQPIVTIMGHVDHGKTSLLDKIMGTAIAASEAGGMTQTIGARAIPLSTIKKICGKLLEKLKTIMEVPGLLFIDTPGHAAFINLRKRGGNLADIAIVIIDLNEGVMPQTKESIEILRHYKTPFIIAVNKIDTIQNWRKTEGTLLENINKQNPETQKKFETKLYEIVSQAFELGIEAERFDRIDDYTKQAAIVPVSAKTGEGIPELLMVLTGLAQKYLEQNLQTEKTGAAKGTILEVREQKGVGTVLDAIIYEGRLEVNEQIIMGTLDEPVQTKVKALLQPEGRTYKAVKEAIAATGIRIVAQGAEKAIAGASIISAKGSIEKIKEELRKETREVITETDKDGIIIKADTLGSLEAMIKILKEKGTPIRKSGIGAITKKDILDAEAIMEKEPMHAVILGFNIPKTELQTRAKIIISDVIYRLSEEYEEWKQKQLKENKELIGLIKPCKIEILKGYVFRQSNPAVTGVEAIAGTLMAKTPLMNKNGKELTMAKEIQVEQKSVEKLEKGKQGAVSFPGVIIGRQLNEGEILYSAVPEEHFKKYKENKEHLNEEEKELLKEIAEIMRKNTPMWGI